MGTDKGNSHWTIYIYHDNIAKNRTNKQVVVFAELLVNLFTRVNVQWTILSVEVQRQSVGRNFSRAELRKRPGKEGNGLWSRGCVPAIFRFPGGWGGARWGEVGAQMLFLSSFNGQNKSFLLRGPRGLILSYEWLAAPMGVPWWRLKTITLWFSNRRRSWVCP